MQDMLADVHTSLELVREYLFSREKSCRTDVFLRAARPGTVHSSTPIRRPLVQLRFFSGSASRKI